MVGARLTRKLWNKEARGSDESSSVQGSPLPPPGISAASDHLRRREYNGLNDVDEYELGVPIGIH